MGESYQAPVQTPYQEDMTMSGVELLPVSTADVQASDHPARERDDEVLTVSQVTEVAAIIAAHLSATEHADERNSLSQELQDVSLDERSQKQQPLDHRATSPSLLGRSESIRSNTSSTGGSSTCSDGSSHCWQHQLVEQCRLLKLRQKFDRVLCWCARQGIIGGDQMFHPPDSQMYRPKSSISTAEMGSTKSGSDFPTNHFDLFANFMDDRSSDDSEQDDDPLDGIPLRFRPPTQQYGGVERRPSWLPHDDSSTLAGEIFWNNQRLSQLHNWTKRNGIPPTPTKVDEHEKSPSPVPNAARRFSALPRQWAFSMGSVDSVDFDPCALVSQCSRTSPDESEPLDNGEKRRFASGSVDACDDVMSTSESDDSVSCVNGQTTAAGYTAEDVDVVRRNRLKYALRLLRADIPMHFWPQLNEPSTCFSS